MPVGVTTAESRRAGGDEEPPYRFIARKLLEGEVVPFLGAGASVFHHPAHPDDKVICPPTGSALAELLAEEAGFLEDPDLRLDLPLVASYFEHVNVDRSGLCDVLNSIFKPEFAPNALHRLLAQVAARKELLIITTNYDDMIERAFDEAKTPYHLVITAIEDLELGGTVKYRAPGRQDLVDEEPSKLDVSLASASIIYKMHGSINRREPNVGYYVITEEDYIKFLGRMSIVPDKIVASLTLKNNNIKRLLFLGYSLSDWNFRVMLDMLWNVGKGREPLRSYAIQRQPGKVEARIWDTKEVKVFDLDLQEFTDQLREEVRLQS
jgi:hypothetical protein